VLTSSAVFGGGGSGAGNIQRDIFCACRRTRQGKFSLKMAAENLIREN
jgi:hypothetical protein